MWGWANKASNIPNELLTVANALRSHGDKHAITQLTTAKLPLNILAGHTVGLIACGFANGKAYYRCPYENGALFVLITDPGLKLSVENRIARATRVIPECISALEITDQRGASAAYLRQHGLEVVEEGGKLLVYGDDQPVLSAEFDEMNRLTKIESHLKPKDGK
jgi:hypothetical protein